MIRITLSGREEKITKKDVDNFGTEKTVKK